MGKVHIIEQEQDGIQSVVFPGLALFPCPVTQEKVVAFNFSNSVSSTTCFRKGLFFPDDSLKSKQLLLLLSGYCQINELSIVLKSTGEGDEFLQPLY